MYTTTRFVQYVNKSNNIRSLSTILAKKNGNPNFIWSQLVMKDKKENLVKLRVQNIPENRFQDVIDLKMNHFVKEEVTYKVSGINESREASMECREVFLKSLSDPTTHTHGYFVEDESKPIPELIAASTMKLISRNYPEKEKKVKTKEMKKLSEIIHAWDQLCTHDEVFKRYGVDCFYDDGGIVTDPKYRMLGIAKYDALVRRLVCRTHGVAVTGAWCTMMGTQRACEVDKWDTLFEMPYEELERHLGINFKDPPPTCKYMALKVL